MAEVLHWRDNADPRQVISRAVRAVVEGGLVAFPTETGYGVAASALVPEAVERLRECTGTGDDVLPVAVPGAAEALDWMPRMNPLSRRLARRCWPGPVTLVGADGVNEGLAARLPDPVRRLVYPGGKLGLCSPAHDAVVQALGQLPVPIVISGIRQGDGGEAVSAGDVMRAAGEWLNLIINDGPGRPGQRATVVEVNGRSWEILREGVVSAEVLRQLSCTMVVFVCTGNTCRSPLAEGLFKKRLAERLGCTADDLPARGFVVLSAGLAAMMGGQAAPEAVEVAREFGADLSRHASRPLNPELAAQADHLIVMTRGHLLAVNDLFPRLAVRPRLLCGQGDVPDPIGCEQEVYYQCARNISEHLDRLVPEVLQS